MENRVKSESNAQVKEADTVKISALPNVKTFRTWKMALHSELATASGRYDAATKWVREVEGDKTTFESLADSGPIFTQLDGKLTLSLRF